MLGHEPSTKHYIQVALSNIATLIAVVIGTIIIVAFAQGYNFDFSTREIVQTGLLRLESRPVNAYVDVDGDATDELTPFKVNPEAGLHDIKLSRAGYRDWSKSIDISGGEVLWLTYPLLVPNEIDQKDWLANPKNQLLSYSPTRNHVAYSTENSIRVRDLGVVSPEVTVNTPADFELRGGSRQIIWLPNGESFLLSGTINDEAAFFVYDIAGEEIQNVTDKLAGYNPLAFIENNEQYIIASRGKSLFAVSVSGSTTTPLSSDFSKLESISSHVAWVEAGASIQVWDGNEVSRVSLLDVDESIEKYKLFSYQNTVYLTYQTGEDNQRIVKNALFGSFERRFSQGKLLSVSPNGQFILYQKLSSPNDFGVFDIQKERDYGFVLGQSPEEAPLPSWAGSHHLTGVIGNNAFIIDFDGTNYHTLATGEISSVALAQNQRFAYIIEETDQLRVVKQLDMFVEPEN